MFPKPQFSSTVPPGTYVPQDLGYCYRVWESTVAVPLVDGIGTRTVSTICCGGAYNESGLCPENSMMAISQAIGLGITNIHLTVDISADGIYIVIPTSEVKRSNQLSGLPIAQSRAIDLLGIEYVVRPFINGIFREGIPTGEKIRTLDTCITAASKNNPNVRFFLECSHPEALVAFVSRQEWRDRVVVYGTRPDSEFERIVTEYNGAPDWRKVAVAPLIGLQMLLTLAGARDPSNYTSYFGLVSGICAKIVHRYQGINVFGWALGYRDYPKQIDYTKNEIVAYGRLLNNHQASVMLCDEVLVTFARTLRQKDITVIGFSTTHFSLHDGKRWGLYGSKIRCSLDGIYGEIEDGDKDLVKIASLADYIVYSGSLGGSVEGGSGMWIGETSNL